MLARYALYGVLTQIENNDDAADRCPIAASCYVGSNPNQKTRRTFEFEWYKGNIYIKQR